MIITKQQLEDVFLHDEKSSEIKPEVWCLLYLATRNDGVINAADAVYIVQSDPLAVSVLAEHFFDASDVAAIQKLSSEIAKKIGDERCDEAISKRMLDGWIAKMMMLEVMQKRQEECNQIRGFAE